MLVVFNVNSDTSRLVKDYYQSARGIPGSNVLGLSRLVDTLVSDGTTEHWIKLEQQGEIIEDTIHRSDYLESRHAWIYFNERIAIPIANYLKTTIVNGDTLKNKIRYIVLCKGVPFKIQAVKEITSIA